MLEEDLGKSRLFLGYISIIALERDEEEEEDELTGLKSAKSNDGR